MITVRHSLEDQFFSHQHKPQPQSSNLRKKKEIITIVNWEKVKEFFFTWGEGRSEERAYKP